MAKVEGEKRSMLSKAEKGLGVKDLKFRFSIGAEDMHYPGEMISGCKLIEKCIDCCTELCNIRDNGDGGLIVHIDADIVHPAHVLDAVEVICWSITVGSRSRLYGFEMYKTSEYDQETDRSEVFDEAVLTVKGTVVFVVDDPQ